MSTDLVKYTPDNAITELMKCNSIELCLKSETVTLATIKKDSGEESVLSIINAWIIDVNDFLNVSRKMNVPQIKQTSAMILTDFYYFKIADINLVFQNAKKGMYGSMYESLDGLKIYQWFEQYALQRANIAFQENLRIHDLTK